MPLTSSSILAYGSRYHTPFKHLTLISPPISSCYTSLPRVPTANLRTLSFIDSSLSTGNFFLSRMEKYFFGTGGGKNKNRAMVEQLQRYGVFQSDKVTEVMETIDRGLFVPSGTPAYVDSPMPIGHNATISAPHMHAMCLELLKDHLQPGMHALDIGSGTGYLTACFAVMVGSQGRAVGIEHIPELVTWSIENIKKSAAAPLLEEGSLSVHVGDGRLGYPEAAPYDAIHVGAAAPEIPEALIEQLKPGGRLVIPVGTYFQDLKVVDKQHDGKLNVRTETSVRYVPLTSREEQLQG
ncbi:protein-L-isoaspartate O-methyltransferase-like [Amaranthus tricolor]|uniref:protein-L-isoaspartate O-methyltransferase-like n=1 Tax=Amaranthus tricolor TaxID=29722 RepID=UPI00258D700F|nr:protein-L-isoaspartate O-methyltransferase-like [Amaranthus tricolor]